MRSPHPDNQETNGGLAHRGDALCVARVSSTHGYLSTMYVAIASTCPRVRTFVRSPSQEGVWAETLPKQRTTVAVPRVLNVISHSSYFL